MKIVLSWGAADLSPIDREDKTVMANRQYRLGRVMAAFLVTSFPMLWVLAAQRLSWQLAFPQYVYEAFSAFGNCCAATVFMYDVPFALSTTRAGRAISMLKLSLNCVLAVLTWFFLSQLSPAGNPIDRVLIAAAFVVSVLVLFCSDFLLQSYAVTGFDASTNDRASAVERSAPDGLNRLLTALGFVGAPFGLSLVVTLVLYFIPGFDANVANVGSVFGAVFAVFIFIAAEMRKRTRQGTGKESGD